jgi:hypothetical protein
MEREIKVVQHGVGRQGRLMVEFMLRKAGIRIVGAVDIVNVGKDLGEVIGLDTKLGVSVSDNLDTVLAETKPDVMLDATFPYIEQLYPVFMRAIKAKVNIISIGAGAFNSWASAPELAKNLDEAARTNGVSVLGTGMGPGFEQDTLPLFLTGVCSTVKKITFNAVNDASQAGPAFRKRWGCGLTKEEAERKLASGDVKFLFGYAGQVRFVADCLGWKIAGLREEKEFIISKTARDFANFRIEPGQVCGFRHNCYAMEDGEIVIEMKSTVDAGASFDGLEPGYILAIEGEPSFTVNIPGIVPEFGFKGTAARAVNWIPYIIKARPGLLTNGRDYPMVTCLPQKSVDIND